MQILHGELETSIQAAEERLVSTNDELEKQKELNEKLENDLLHMDKHNTNARPDSNSPLPELTSLDALAGIELGKKPTVGLSFDSF